MSTLSLRREKSSQSSQPSATEKVFPRPETRKPISIESKHAVTTTEHQHDQTHRTLKTRHIQLISIGGVIGTVLFVQIGTGLQVGGPAGLLLAFIAWSTVVLAVNECLAEMVTWIPISSPYVRFADHFVDEALGVCSGFNLFFSIGISIPYEIVAFNLMLNFWTDKIPVIGVILFITLCYGAINLFAVRFYGESEFWLAIGKVVLILGLLVFTFVVMVGGNPEVIAFLVKGHGRVKLMSRLQHDAFGFRNWNVPGGPFVAYIYEGSLGHFLGLLSSLVQAAFTLGGPEFIAMTAGEVAHPRRTLPRSFHSLIGRLIVFFVLGTLAVGILVPYTDPELLPGAAARPGAGSSPYVIAMQRLHLGGLAHVVNALVMLSIFSAGNSYVYTASRTLFGMALEGRVPRVLAKCTASGVPVYSVCVTMLFSLLAFLQLGSTSGVVLQWITRFATASAMANYSMIAFTYLRFHAALKAQGVPRDSLPYHGSWQPFCGYYAFIGSFIMMFVSGYVVFLPGHWNTTTFIFSYALIALLPVIFIGWKIARHTQWRNLREVDFFREERAEVDAYETKFEASNFAASGAN
ncbi:General amino acid permease AGP2 [Mycena sanguinolenta]|uniref:General amino acid permease AGP2 n=1 Tax=Mycena sanguinolenta TaxID=230812 RepID=A0A8H6ZCV9_9AGAR|nr:General amino acid permease AGP2 [Mycena sanguinolenta]